MTDDYQAAATLPDGLAQDAMDGLLTDLGATAQESPDQPEVEAAVEPQAQEGGAEQPDAEAEEDQVALDPEEENRNRAFAELRASNAQYKKFISHLMKGSNFEGDENAFIEQLTNLSYEQQAKNQSTGASPELLKRLDSLEQTNTQLIEAQNRQMFLTNVDTLTKKFNLSQADVKEFIEKAVAEDIDLTVPGTNFVTLYQGLFFDKIKEKLIEEERQTWIAKNTKADNSAVTPDGKSGKKDPSPTNVNTMAEFTSLLQNMNPKK